MMLTKKERLTRAQFDRSFSIGKRIHTPHMQIIIAESDSFHGAVVVPKKVYKKAVDRNSVRRKLYAVLYETNKKRNLHKTIILIVKSAITSVPKSVYIPELRIALEKF
jgi:ribonuclease P protein component